MQIMHRHSWLGTTLWIKVPDTGSVGRTLSSVELWYICDGTLLCEVYKLGLLNLIEFCQLNHCKVGSIWYWNSSHLVFNRSY